MPIFYRDEWGIDYEIRFNEGNHSRPHIHVSYDNKEASISIIEQEVLANNGLSNRAIKKEE